MTSWFSFWCLKQWFLKPVSKIWDLQNLSTFQIFLFSETHSQFSHVCLSSWWEVTRISLAFANKQALVLGCPGIRNSRITERHVEWIVYLIRRDTWETCGTIHRRKMSDWSTRDHVTLPNSKWRQYLHRLFIPVERRLIAASYELQIHIRIFLE